MKPFTFDSSTQEMCVSINRASGVRLCKLLCKTNLTVRARLWKALPEEVFKMAFQTKLYNNVQNADFVYVMLYL